MEKTTDQLIEEANNDKNLSEKNRKSRVHFFGIVKKMEEIAKEYAEEIKNRKKPIPPK